MNAAMAACGASRTWQRAVALTHQLQYAWQAQGGKFGVWGSLC